MSEFGVILVHIFLVFSRIRTKYGEYLSVFSPNEGKCGKNVDQNNSHYGHFLRCDEKSHYASGILFEWPYA